VTLSDAYAAAVWLRRYSLLAVTVAGFTCHSNAAYLVPAAIAVAFVRHVGLPFTGAVVCSRHLGSAIAGFSRHNRGVAPWRIWRASGGGIGGWRITGFNLRDIHKRRAYKLSAWRRWPLPALYGRGIVR